MTSGRSEQRCRADQAIADAAQMPGAGDPAEEIRSRPGEVGQISGAYRRIEIRPGFERLVVCCAPLLSPGFDRPGEAAQKGRKVAQIRNIHFGTFVYCNYTTMVIYSFTDREPHTTHPMKGAHTMQHITVHSTEEAWSKANELFPTDYEYDSRRSAKAGYPIYWTTKEDATAWISDINVALELNIQHEDYSIETIKIDIEEEPEAEEAQEEQTEDGSLWVIDYGKDKPGIKSETFKGTYREAWHHAADNNGGWGFEVKASKPEEQTPEETATEAPKAEPRKKTSAAIRRWENAEWSFHHPTSQWELQRMARAIFSQAEHIEDQETPGHSSQDLSRVYTVTSSLLPDLEYIIHIDGFKVQDICEIRRF